MNQELTFEVQPFEAYAEFGELYPELGNLEWEEEFGRRFPARRPGLVSRPPRVTAPRLRRPLPPGPKLPKKRPGRPPCPLGRRPCPPWGIVREPYGVVSEPYPFEPEPTGSEYVRWVQDCLNQALGLQLPLNGVMGPETRSAVRSFQRQRGLRASGIVGPDTEEALRGACGARPSSPEEEGIFAGLTGQQETDLEEEYRITSNCKIEIKFLQTINLANRAEWNTVPKETGGVYVIRTEHLNTRRPRVENRVHYVGKEDRFLERFNARYKVLRDLALDLEVLRGRTVHLYRVSSEGCSTVEHRKAHRTSPRPWSRRAFSDGVARSIAEWALARFYGRGLPGGLPPGNVGTIEAIHVLPPARLEVILDGNRIFPLFP